MAFPKVAAAVLYQEDKQLEYFASIGNPHARAMISATSFPTRCFLSPGAASGADERWFSGEGGPGHSHDNGSGHESRDHANELGFSALNPEP